MSTDLGNKDILVKSLVWQAIPILPEIPVRFRKYRKDSRKSNSFSILVGMFADYKSLVLLDYQKKREANSLPPPLVRPSPAKLRAACLMVCEEGFKPSDLPNLRTYFGPCHDKPTCIEAIRRFDTGKFKALGNFLKGETTTPDDKIIEILAWLIDFTPRPHEFGRKYPVNAQGDEKEGQPTTQPTKNEPAPEQPKKEAVEAEGETPTTSTNGKKIPPGKKRRWSIIALFILIFGGAGFYWLTNSSSSGPTSCMLWSGDHYQPISCNQHPDKCMVIPLDSQKITNFKKITRPDTISENALGSIWYVKYQNNYECYTAPGYHPIDTTLKLQKLTDYVLIRYIHPGLEPAALLPHQ